MLISGVKMGTVMKIELNGFDEAGIIGENLRFIRASIDVENSLRPFIYNLLHFSSITTSKRVLSGFSDPQKIDYVRMILSDPAIDVNHYVFSTTHQLDVLRRFTFLEEKQFYGQRRQLVEGLNAKDYDKIWKVVEYTKRYAKTPFWMESFVKSYAYRMIIEEMSKTSNLLSNLEDVNQDYLAISFVDGGFPFVFWWNEFLTNGNRPNCFSEKKTPIIGITKGDEYYPIVSLAGNIAYITNSVPGMVYPHNVQEVPRLGDEDLKKFYHDFSDKLAKPKFHNRVLFFGGIYTQLQYSIPFLLSTISNHKKTYEPFRLRYQNGGTLKSFYKAFAGRQKNDIILHGRISRPEDQKILDECKDRGIECQEVKKYVPQFKKLLKDIIEESKASNLSKTHISKIESRIRKIEAVVNKLLV